jgi:hypothetical protein
MRNRISGIFECRPIAKVFNSVVSFVAVEVANLQSVRRPEKRQRHELVLLFTLTSP